MTEVRRGRIHLRIAARGKPMVSDIASDTQFDIAL